MEPARFHHLKAARGFSLVEMLVVLAIIAIVTTIALVSQSSFNRSLFLTDTAYSVALSIREVQTLGLSSRVFGTGGSAVQNAGYGAYFLKTNPGSYILFADTYRPSAGSVPSNCLIGPTSPPTPETKPGDCIYTAGQDGIVETNTFSRGFTVSDMCATTASGRVCSSTDALTALSITFLRSSTETMAEALISGAWTPVTKEEIYVTSADGLGTRGICVSQVGQVSVATATCP
jgi:prepilin-type N-terminal cleavage/methylation domain-containing protein